MSRIAYCPGCSAEKHGVKSRVAIEHTCGRDQHYSDALMEAMRKIKRHGIVFNDTNGTIREDPGECPYVPDPNAKHEASDDLPF